MSRQKGGLGAPALPQVNLLPPEVRSARALSVVKRWLGLSLVLVLVLAGMATVFASMQVTDAEAELARQNSETEALLTEQLAYAEVPVVLGHIDRVKAARTLGMSTDILWADYLGAITAVVPDDVMIETASYVGGNPMTAHTMPANVLADTSVGQITFIGRAETLPDTAAWIDALNSIPGLDDAWLTVAEVNGDDETSYYKVTSAVQLTAEAYSGRHDADADAEQEDE